MRSKSLIRFAPALLAAALAFPAAANDLESRLDIDPIVLSMDGFLRAHPDIRWQRDGMHSYEKGDYEIALRQFRRAALHADKVSQAMIATMYWDGVGVAVDRELGYVWMDIAAERMYPDLLVHRERYWEQLDEGQRKRAIERGHDILAEFGDAAAKPRQAKAMERERRMATGNRTGGASVAAMTIIPFTGKAAGQTGPYGFNGVKGLQPRGYTLTGDQYYADQYWKPEQYWAMHDTAWDAPERPADGKVDVGAPEKLRRRGD